MELLDILGHELSDKILRAYSYNRNQIELIAKELQPCQKVLDLCIGFGNLAKVLAEQGKAVYGVDIRKDSLEYAKRKVNSTKLYLVRGDARQLPIIESSFDGASCASSFSFYDQDLEQASNEVYRALKDGGLFALTGMEMRTHFIQGGEQMIRDVEKSYRRGELTTDDMIRATSFDPLQITPDGAVDCSERTKEALEKAGFRIKKLKHFNDGVGYFILVEKCS